MYRVLIFKKFMKLNHISKTYFQVVTQTENHWKKFNYFLLVKQLANYQIYFHGWNFYEFSHHITSFWKTNNNLHLITLTKKAEQLIFIQRSYTLQKSKYMTILCILELFYYINEKWQENIYVQDRIINTSCLVHK